LATLLWCDSGEETAVDNLRTCLWRLRKALSDSQHHIIASEGEDILLDRSAFKIDALALRQLAAQSGESSLEAAAGLCSGEFLEGFVIDSEGFEAWRRAETMRFHDEIIDVLTRFMTHLGEHGDSSRAIEVGNRILRLEPLHDAVVRRLMGLYKEDGRRGAAVQLYRQHDHALRTELNVTPEPATREVLAGLTQSNAERSSVGRGGAPELNEVSSPLIGEAPHKPVADIPPANLLWALRSRAFWGIAGGLTATAAIALFVQFRGLSDSSYDHLTSLEIHQGVSSATAAESISIAVLPFTNMSGDTAQDFFADGVSEEVTSALVKVPGLRVTGRSSAFRFKGQNRDFRTVGRSLNAPYLLDGSIRKAGNRVRITAQLVRTEDGVTVWTESYDRELTDILAIQQDIAHAIAAALRMPLGLPGKALATGPEIDVSTYEYYLRAKAALRGIQAGSGTERGMDGIHLLEQVVARNPEFAPAWASLASAYDILPIYSTATFTGSADGLSKQYAEKAQAAAERAIRLDPNLAEGHLSMAFIEVRRRDMVQAFDNITKALSLDPTNPDVLAAYRNMLLVVGRVDEALAVQQRVAALEPFVPRFHINLGTNFWLAGRDKEAIEILGNDRSANGLARLAEVNAARGRYVEAAEALESIPAGAFPKGALKAAARLLRKAPSSGPLDGIPQLGALGFVYLHAGAPGRVLEFYEASIDRGYPGIWPLWHEVYAPVRQTERFKTLVKRLNLPEFWRARGWPDLCHPIGADDFACE
jgi:TolB-like protein/DNA-binding SARP family transcriptional activator